MTSPERDRALEAMRLLRWARTCVPYESECHRAIANLLDKPEQEGASQILREPKASHPIPSPDRDRALEEAKRIVAAEDAWVRLRSGVLLTDAEDAACVKAINQYEQAKGSIVEIARAYISLKSSPTRAGREEKEE